MYTGLKKKTTNSTKQNTVQNSTQSTTPKYTKESLAQSNPNLYFSDADIDTMNKSDKFANGIISAKNRYVSATTPEAQNEANRAAESLRVSYGGYSGGSDGSQYNPIYDPTDVSKPTYEKQGTKPTYTAPAAYNSKYTATIDDLYNKITNAKFEYDKNNDPQYQALAAMTSRQARNASNNALAAARNGSGFASSTAAISAAQQGYNNQMAQLNDAIPQLYANAYNEFNTERENLYNALQTAMQRDSVDYGRYRNTVSDRLNEYNLAYNDYRNDVADGLNEYNLDYNDYRNKVADNWDVLNHREAREDLAYDRTQAEQAARAAQEQAEESNYRDYALELIDRYGYDILDLLGLGTTPTMAYTKNDADNYATYSGVDIDWQKALNDRYNAETDRNYKQGTLANNAAKIANDYDIGLQNVQNNKAKIVNDYNVAATKINKEYGAGGTKSNNGKITDTDKALILSESRKLKSSEGGKAVIEYADELAAQGAIDADTYKEICEMAGVDTKEPNTVFSDLVSMSSAFRRKR